MARDNTYAFFRYNDEEAVFVFANASEEAKVIPTAHYEEILSHYNTKGVNVLTGEEVNLAEDIKVEELNTLIVKLSK